MGNLRLHYLYKIFWDVMPSTLIIRLLHQLPIHALTCLTCSRFIFQLPQLLMFFLKVLLRVQHITIAGSQVSGALDVHSAHALPATDRHYNIWEYHPPAFFSHGTHANSEDQTSISSAMRSPGLDSDGLSRAGSPVHPFMARYRSRTAGSFPSSLVPPYLPNPGAQAHVHEHSQGNHGTNFAGVRRSGSSRGFTSAGPTSISPPDHAGFYYLYPPTQTSGQSLQDVESNEGNRFYAWETDRLAPFPLLGVDRESGWLGPVPQSTASLDSNNIMGFWHQHGAERPSSEGRSEGSTYWPSTHASRMRPTN